MGNEASSPREEDASNHDTSNYREVNGGSSIKNGSTPQQSRKKIASFMRGSSRKAPKSENQDTEGGVSNHHPLHEQNGGELAYDDMSSKNAVDRNGNVHKLRKKKVQHIDKNWTEQQAQLQHNSSMPSSDNLQAVMYASRSSSTIRTAMSSAPSNDILGMTAKTGELSLQGNMIQGDRVTQGINIDQEVWQNNWFDDEESSDEDDDYSDESDAGNSIDAAVSGGSPNRLVVSQTHQMLRPTLDGGHSSSFPMRVESVDDLTTELKPVNEEPLNSKTRQTSLPHTHPLYAQYRGEQLKKAHKSEIIRNGDKVLDEVGVLGVKQEPISSSPNKIHYEKPNESMFSLLRVLGKGSFGKVILVQKQNGSGSGRLFAMKILKKTYLQRRGQIQRTKTERKVLSFLDHPFIMKLYFAFETDDKLHFVLDYCAGGELFFHLSRARRFSEKYTRFYAGELVLALGHCHDSGIIYRDLKPENVLLDSDGHVKLGDFGLAKDNITHAYRGANSMCGTPEYMAPEILQQLGHGWCVDYWGLGMLVYEMMTGLPPWYTKDRNTLYRRLKSAPLDIPPFFSSKASAFVYWLLQRDPRRRLGVGGKGHVMTHNFFQDLDFEKLIKRQISPPIKPCEAWRKHETSEHDTHGHLTRDEINNTMSHIKSTDLDVATANFDKQFLRMPVNSNERNDNTNNTEEANSEELNENTFAGFSFDGYHASGIL